MSTNFIQWNPGSSNQESDATYSADAQRSGGFQTNQEVPSPLLNKVLYQVSTMVTALANALVNAGYSPEDTNLATLTTLLETALILNAGYEALSFTATPTWNAASNSTFAMTLTGNVTGQTITGPTAGQLITFIWTQDGTGGRTVAYPSTVKGAAAIYAAANSTTTQTFRADASGNLWAISGAVVSNA